MKWKNISLRKEDEEKANALKKDLEDNKIITGKLFVVDNTIKIPYMPIGKQQEEKALEILNKYLWDWDKRLVNLAIFMNL